MAASVRSRGWCFTYWGEGGDHENGIQGVLPDASVYEGINCEYIIVGLERSKEGWLHHQGYVYFKNAITRSSLNKKLPRGANNRPAKGNAEQNFDYCSKESILIEDGTRPAQGERTDLDKIRELVKSSGKMRDVVDVAPSYQAIKMAEVILKYQERQRTWEPNVKWFWGPAGAGKTTTALKEMPDAWVSGKSLKWWEGYDGHEDVIIDDFRGDFCTYHELLLILGGQPFRVENKGGSRQLLARNIIITSCYPPDKVYKTVENLDQLWRRLSEVRRFERSKPLKIPSMNFCVNGTEVGSDPEPIIEINADSTALGGCVNTFGPTQKSGVILCPDFHPPQCKEMDGLIDEILSLI